MEAVLVKSGHPHMLTVGPCCVEQVQEPRAEPARSSGLPHPSHALGSGRVTKAKEQWRRVATGCQSVKPSDHPHQVGLLLVKFFKHSGPLPNPTRTDNHDNSDNVAPRSRPSSVHTHHQSDRPTAQDSQRRGPRSPISIAAGDTPSAKLPGISTAPPLYSPRVILQTSRSPRVGVAVRVRSGEV